MTFYPQKYNYAIVVIYIDW